MGSNPTAVIFGTLFQAHMLAPRRRVPPKTQTEHYTRTLNVNRRRHQILWRINVHAADIAGESSHFILPHACSGIQISPVNVNVVPTNKRWDPGSNWRPSDLQSDALPTELSLATGGRLPGANGLCVTTTHHPPSRPRGSTVSFVDMHS